jgi:hypothetical protein
MIPKKKTTKKTAKKVVKKEVEEKIEDTKVEEDIPKRYYVQFWARVQPSEPRYDEMVGTIYWSDVKCGIEIESLHNKYSSMIENLMEGDLLLDNGLFMSRYETPKEWVRNLHRADLGKELYAKDFMEIVDETE